MGNRKKYTPEQLQKIMSKTHGFCHLCPRGPYTLDDYGKKWQVEHSTALANDGRDDMTNWFVACVPCNQKKGVGSSADFRKEMGVGGVPFSTKERRDISKLNFFRVPGLFLMFALAFAGLSATVDGPAKMSPQQNVIIIVGAVISGLLISVLGHWFIFSTRGRESRSRRDE